MCWIVHPNIKRFQSGKQCYNICNICVIFLYDLTQLVPFLNVELSHFIIFCTVDVQNSSPLTERNFLVKLFKKIYHCCSFKWVLEFLEKSTLFLQASSKFCFKIIFRSLFVFWEALKFVTFTTFQPIFQEVSLDK